MEIYPSTSKAFQTANIRDTAWLRLEAKLVGAGPWKQQET